MNEAVSKKKHDTLLIYTQVVDDSHPILGFFIGWVTAYAKDFTEVHVIAMQVGDYTLPGNVTVYSLGKEHGYSKPRQLVRFYRHFARIYFRERPQFVFFHMGAIFNILAAPFFYLSRFSKTRFYWWKAHGHLNYTGRVATLFVDKVFTSTLTGFPLNTKKRKIVGQAIDSDLFLMPETDKRTRKIIYVGRIMPVKKIEHFLKTFIILRDLGLNIDISIIGPVGDDLYYRDELLPFCQKNKITESVFLGSLTQIELVKIYQEAFVFLNTSHTHSMDKTVLEAMLCGCIPVTSNKAFEELLFDDNLYIENASAEDYAICIKDILEGDSEKIRFRVRELVKAKHSLATFSERVFGAR